MFSFLCPAHSRWVQVLLRVFKVRYAKTRKFEKTDCQLGKTWQKKSGGCHFVNTVVMGDRQCS